MTPARRALVASALGAGVSYSNLAVALPLLILAEHGSSFLTGALIGTNTVAFSLGALLALALRRSEGGSRGLFAASRSSCPTSSWSPPWACSSASRRSCSLTSSV